jgi:hypothetical protein
MLTQSIPPTTVTPEETVLFYLSFRDLNQLVDNYENCPELQIVAETILKKRNPTYQNLKAAKATKNFRVLIDNIKSTILPSLQLSFPEVEQLPSEEAIYKELCRKTSALLHQLIQREFYTSRVANARENQFMRDCIFHYCQHNPQEAGRILNQNVGKFWNGFVTNCLIEYGADLNAIYNDSFYPTLLQYIKFNSDETTLRKLLEKGANCHAYKEEHEGVTYSLMLVAALDGDEDVITVLAEKFPEEVEKTLKLLEVMQTKKEAKFRCAIHETIYLSSENGERKMYYTPEEIVIAQVKLKRIAMQNTSQVYASASKENQHHFFTTTRTDMLRPAVEKQTAPQLTTSSSSKL